MRLFQTVGLSLVLAIPFTAGAQAAGRAPAATRTPVERALFAVEDEWTRALVHRDGAIFDRLIAPDWVYSDERGIMGKREAIAEFTTGPDSVGAAGNEGIRAHVYGTTAVVTGILWTRGRNKGAPFAHRYRYTDTWMRIDGRWRCIASQDYDMPK